MRKIATIVLVLLMCCCRTVSADSYRNYILAGPDMRQIDMRGEHSLLVCAANLEYYLVRNFGTGVGPDNQKEHDTQRTKTRKALSLINADIYGLCEIEQGTAALQEICADLNAAHKERNYTWVNTSATETGGDAIVTAFVYDTKKVLPLGSRARDVSSGVKERKYLQCFKELATEESFVFSMNHFKAYSDQNVARVAEANALNSEYDSYKKYCREEDLLIMGDLNCHRGDEPISILLDDGTRTDLHRYFHADSSYSYYYQGRYDYIDHAICNVTLLPQITGMQAFHCNSRESYRCEYQYGDTTLFRYSDHDPILVGLRLSSSAINELTVLNYGADIHIHNGEGGFVRIYDMNGNLVYSRTLESNDELIVPNEEIPMMHSGCYVMHVYHNGQNNIRKYIRP
ncbi:MAG: hypothetical protein MJZ75_04100 [Paludibacteraceae bacterium]|nr:hypothetical protein [Paludibacteraceae bacterium]